MRVPSRASRFFEPAGPWSEFLGAFQSDRFGHAVRRISAHRAGRAATAITARPPYVPPTSFDAGQIKAHMHHGSGAAEIGGIIQKTDGTHPAQRSPSFCELCASANPVRIQCETNAKPQCETSPVL